MNRHYDSGGPLDDCLDQAVLDLHADIDRAADRGATLNETLAAAGLVHNARRVREFAPSGRPSTGLSRAAAELLSPDDERQLSWFRARAGIPGTTGIEVAAHPDGVAVRHSAAPEERAVLFSREEFAAFLDSAKQGEFDRLVDVPIETNLGGRQ